MSKESKKHKKYSQSPRAFWQKIRAWLTDGHRGGEGKQAIENFIHKNNIEFIKNLSKSAKSRTVRGFFIVLLFCGIGVILKHGKGDSIPVIIFDNLESIALGSAGLIFLLESQDRRKRDHYEAWRVINSAQGQTGSGGRIQALQDLNSDGVDLEGVSAPKADLSGIQLPNSNLCRANFSRAQLDGANFQEANLQFSQFLKANLLGINFSAANLSDSDLRYTDLTCESNLERAILERADLSNAALWGAKLSEANLSEAIMKEADFLQANLEKANLEFACLEKASLLRANLEGANLRKTNLQESNLMRTIFDNANLEDANLENSVLRGASFKNANLEGANLHGVSEWSDEQLSQAKLCKTNLPEGSTLDPDRDCWDRCFM